MRVEKANCFESIRERYGIYDSSLLKTFKDERLLLIEDKTHERRIAMNVLRRKSTDEEKETAKAIADVLKDELKELRKEVMLAENIEQRSEVMKERIELIEKEEVKEYERRW